MGRAKRVCEVPYKFDARKCEKSKLGTREVMNYLLHVLNLAPDYIRFAIVGGIGALVNFGVLSLLRYIFGVPHIYASFTAIEVSVISNFILNEHWTFKYKNRKGSWPRLLKYHGSSALGILMQWLTSVTIYYLLLPESITAQFIGILLGFMANYVFSKKFVWSYHT